MMARDHGIDETDQPVRQVPGRQRGSQARTGTHFVGEAGGIGNRGHDGSVGVLRWREGMRPAILPMQE